jgi:hypothetical protein
MLKLFKKKKFDLEAFIAGSMEGMQLVTDSHKAAWRLGQEKFWRVDEDEGTIAFCFADGVVVSAPVQIVGIYNSQEHLFDWGWNHAGVVTKFQQHALQVKGFGAEYQVKEMVGSPVPCTEKRAMEYTALAMLLAEASGAYRVQLSPGNWVYMTFGKVTISG